MNPGYRYAIFAVAVVLTLVTLGAVIGLQTSGSASSVSGPPSSSIPSSISPTSSLGSSIASSSSTVSSTVTLTLSMTTSSMTSSSTSSASANVSSSSSTSSSVVSGTTSEQSSTSSSSGQNGAEIVLPYDVGENESLNFQPASITVVIGVNNTVTWVDMDSIQHTVVSTAIPAGAQKFDSGILNQGQTFTWTFTVPGTYHYDCTIHPDWMKGTIRVLA